MAESSSRASDESKNSFYNYKCADDIETNDEIITTNDENIRIYSVDKLTVEKITLDKAGIHEVLFTKTESTKESLESTKRYSTRSEIKKPCTWRSEGDREQITKFKKNKGKCDGSIKKNDNTFTTKSVSKLPVWKAEKIKSIGKLNDKKIKLIKATDNSSNENCVKSDRVTFDISKICKISPIISPKQCKNIVDDNKNDLIGEKYVTVENKKIFLIDNNECDRKCQDPASITAYARLEKSQAKIQRLQRNLVKINAETAESYIQKLPVLHQHVLKASNSSDLDLNKNITKVTFNKEFLSKHSFDPTLNTEETRPLETDIDYISDAEKITLIQCQKPKYSNEVSEIEKRWSGEFLENQFGQNSSESSKSSYIEEIGSISSHESVVEQSQSRVYNHQYYLEQEKSNQEYQKRTFDEILEDTVSTIGSISHIDGQLGITDEYVEDDDSKNSTLKQSSSTNSCLLIDINEIDGDINLNDKCFGAAEHEKVIIPSDESDDEDEPEVNKSIRDSELNFSNEKRQYTELRKVIVTEGGLDEELKCDGYAELIKGITMEPGSSKGKDEKKKRGGLRRLLPGLFSPKESRKEYKKEHKEKKKRDERHFNQHQQNGIYMRSPDTMHLNEDIKKNVNLDTSLNGTIIEERLNEIKQELFPDQGMTTSTPDHFLQSDRDHILGRRTPRLYTANSSLSSIAVEDKWIDQNIISGSPDMRKFKQHVRNDNDRKCNLERKHSFQESQPQFVRNHGPTGRISAPPSERFLIRPRAVHPVDRPLPAIPQKVEFSNYENHEEIRKQPGVFIRGDRINYQSETYFVGNQNFSNERELYGNSNNLEKTEINRNQSIDSGFNMTPVSTQLKVNRQIINNQNGQKVTCGMARSPKYSPSSSQKSGDYADSSYTPNSSQKSEFSPGSSKSGEYYLNSPRNSSRMSPDYSINDRRDQLDHESTKSSMSYQIPSNIRVQIKDDRIYNEPPKSPFEPDKSSGSPRHLHHNTSQDLANVQRGSPIIPLSSNLAKLRANVGTSSPCVESPENSGAPVQSPLIPSPPGATRTCISPTQLPNQRDITKSPCSNSPITVSPQRQRFTSPLTIITPASPVSCNNTLSPNGSARSIADTPLSAGLISPPRILMHGRETSCRTPVSSPTINQMQTSGYPRMSTFQPRKAQPNDQILIASPKRELIYDSQPQRSSSRMESGCPDSPVPMVDSPCHSISPRQNFHKTVTVRLNKTKSPDTLEISEQLPPEAFRDEPPKMLHSSQSLSPQSSDKGIQRPEPIYVERKNFPSKILPEKLNLERGASSTDTRSSMLLIPAKQDNMQEKSLTKQQIVRNTQQPIHVQDYSQCVGSPHSMSPDMRKEPYTSPKDRPDKLLLRKKDGGNTHDRPQGIYGNQKLVIQDRNTSTEDIYGKRLQQSPGPSPIRSPINQYQQRHEVIVQQHSSTPTQEHQRQRQIYMSKQETLSHNQEQNNSKQLISKEPIYAQRNQKPASGQRIVEPIYSSNSNKKSSPSKRQTMQHLEAFYWQQKALESQKVIQNSPNVSTKSEEPESPEVREAIYWHQLKKLDEEQQRKLYERNQFDERNDPTYWKKKIHSSSPSPTIDSIKHGSSASLATPQHLMIQIKGEQRLENPEQIYWRTQMQSTVNPSAKPPLSGQKGQNQPVLVVRPQQAVRELNQLQSNQKQNTKEFRSKSVSPHFVRNDERRSLQLPRKIGMTLDDGCAEKHHMIVNARKSMTPPIYDDADIDKKQPPPIFKRGSLISNSSSSVEYGTMGTKRVSFSNQSNSPEIGSGNWPTKHGMAPEPPTRKHRTEEEFHSDTNDQNTVRLHEEDQNSINNIYGNTVACASQQFIIYETYDANKPLPPPPSTDSWMMKRNDNVRDDKNERLKVQRANVPASPRKCIMGMSESESGSEAGEVQRILQLRNEEEWNPGGKGRQSNDIGGLGRAEGEGGSNDLPTGRRSGGIGVLGSVVGGRVTGTSGGGGGRSRDEPRRHTLSGDHAPSLHHQQFNAQQFPLHPHHLPLPHGQYATPPTRHTTMDLEMGTKSRQRKSPLPRGYPPPSTAMLFDDDPGIMSEVETACTGFRRGGKQRSSLPVVRTPSKTLERPLGLVFLQYRKETKRALLPNEITSIDTVKALFVRSFPKQLTMEYLDSPDVKVYIHDSNKDMFYELEDHRSHLRDIRDRSVLRLIEKTDGVGGISGPLGAPVGGPPGLPPHWEDQSYFSEPEFDSEFQHQHIHKSKTSKNSTTGNYYMGGSSTLPRGGPIMRAYSPAASAVLAGPNATPTPQKSLGTPGGGGVAPAKPLRGYQCGKTPLGSLGGSARFSRDSSVSLYSIPDRIHGESGYMSSPERGGVGTGTGRYPGGPYSTGSSYEEPYYSQYSGTVTPVIDEEASDTELLEESYSLYGVKPPGRPPSGPPRSPFPPGAPALPPGQPYDVTRIRVEHMERQLANLTGLVQKALTHAPHTSPSPRDYLQIPAGRDPYARSTGAGDEFDKHSSSSSASLPDDSYLRSDVKPPKLGKDKSVSFEKSVSFSDEPPDMNSPKQHSPQHTADTKPTKPAIKSSTLPRMSSQERDRHKPTPPPKPVALAAGQYVYRDLALTPEMYNQLRGLQKKAKDLRQEVRNLRRMSQAQAHTVRETIRDTFITIRAMLLSGGDAAWAAGDAEKIKLSREEDLYKQEMIRLEKDLTELESTVEELRGNVITRKTRVNMSDVENMALILSKSSKTVADLKVRFPSLQEGMKGLLSSEMEKVVREEKFLKEEPDRLESALRRCKKLTGTLVTLKRLASVQEQRLPNAASLDLEETPPITPTSAQHSKTTAPVPAERTGVGSTGVIGGGSYTLESSAAYQQRPENALDALLDELQTFSRPSSQLSQVSCTSQSTNHTPNMLEIGRSASQVIQPSGRAPNISDIGRKGSIDSSTSLAIIPPASNNTLRRLHSYPSSSDTDTSPPIARIQVSDGTIPPQKPPVPERNAELLQLATARRVPPPPPPRTSSRSPLASPTSPQLPPRNPTGTLRRGRNNSKDCGKPPMALPPNANTDNQSQKPLPTNNILSASNSSSCESINSQEGMQNKKDRQEQLEQRHQELLRKQKALQEQYARLQQLQRNASGVTTVPPAPPDLLKKTGSESNLLAKMGLGMSAASSGSLTSLATVKNNNETQQPITDGQLHNVNATLIVGNQTANNKIYETDIL